jgi:hypothetical protein
MVECVTDALLLLGFDRKFRVLSLSVDFWYTFSFYPYICARLRAVAAATLYFCCQLVTGHD